MNAYFFIDPITKQQSGPFSIDELIQKGISSETMVWSSGMADWTAAGAVEELAPLFGGTAPTENAPVEDNAAPSYGQQAQQAIRQQPQTANPQQGQYTNPQQGQYTNPQQGQYTNPQQGQYNNSQQSQYSNMNQTEVRPIPKNWLVESILCTIFCCLPFGIAGIVNASKVESAYYSGDYEASERAAKNAKKWTMISFFVGLSVGILYVAFYAIALIGGSYGY